MALIASRRSSRPLFAGVMVVIAMVAALLLGPVPAAHAVDDRLQFSTDGTTWTSAPPESLFHSGVVLVPGGSVSSTLYVRSTAQTPGVLSAGLTNVRVSDESAEKYFGVRATADIGTGTDGAGAGLDRTAVSDLEEYTRIGLPLTLAPGQGAQFTLAIDLDLRPDGTEAQNSAIGLDLALSFTDASAASGNGGGPSGEAGDGELNPPQIIPAMPASGEQDPHGALDAPAAAAPAAETAPDRGALAVTGFARSLVTAATVTTLLGALLLGISRRRAVRL